MSSATLSVFEMADRQVKPKHCYVALTTMMRKLLLVLVVFTCFSCTGGRRGRKNRLGSSKDDDSVLTEPSPECTDIRMMHHGDPWTCNLPDGKYEKCHYKYKRILGDLEDFTTNYVVDGKCVLSFPVSVLRSDLYEFQVTVEKGDSGSGDKGSFLGFNSVSEDVTYHSGSFHTDVVPMEMENAVLIAMATIAAILFIVLVIVFGVWKWQYKKRKEAQEKKERKREKRKRREEKNREQMKANENEEGQAEAPHYQTGTSEGSDGASEQEADSDSESDGDDASGGGPRQVLKCFCCFFKLCWKCTKLLMMQEDD